MDFLVTLITIILTAILCLPLFKSYKRKKAISKCIDHLPGDKKYPFVGTTLKVLTGDREMFWDAIKDRHIKYGPIFRSWMGSIPVVHIYKPEHAQIIFKSNTNINKGNFYKFLKPWLGGGLISGNLPKWRHHRKVITPAFHFKVMESYGDTFAEKGEYFAKFLDTFWGQGYFEVTQYLTQMSVDVISETAMGVQLDFLKNSQSEYADAIIGFLKVAFKRMYNPMLHNNFVFSLSKIGKESQKSLDYIRKFNKQVIQQRKEYFEKNKTRMQQEDEFGRKEKMSFLDILLAHQENNNFGYEEIEEEVNTFMFASENTYALTLRLHIGELHALLLPIEFIIFAEKVLRLYMVADKYGNGRLFPKGQDTSASTVCWALMALGNDPELLKKVQEELDVIFEDDPDRKITPQDVADMEFLDRVVKETLRCYNFVPYLGRELLEDVVIDGLYIPKGVNVTISLHDLHHDANHYPDPWKFDPDRFLPENVAKRHPFAFVPFSAGPRNCIGQKFGMQNVKTVLAYICRRHNIICQEKPEDLKYYLEVVLRPQEGLHISLEPRQKK